MTTPLPTPLLLAHGVGSRQDLPLSPFYAYAGAFTALLVSFLALGLLWPTPRFTGDTAGRPLPAPLQRAANSRVLRTTLRTAGLAAALFTLAHLLLGPDDPDRNPAPGLVYVLLWVGLAPASLLLGPVWRLLNPLRTLHAALCRLRHRTPGAGRPLPPWLGYRPAALGLLAFTWLELASPAPASRTTLLTFLALYATLHLTAAAIYGTAWFDKADAFETYSTLLGHLSPLGRRPSDSRLVLRNPFHSLDTVPAAPGLTAVVCILLGSTAYDGLSSAPWWINTLQTSPLGRTTVATLGLTTTCLLVATLYATCAQAAHLISRPHPRPTSPHRPTTAFAHSLLPIATGYLIAHYFSLLATEAPRTVTMARGTDNPPPPPDLLTPAGLATLQVTAIVVGHVLGVIAAHDRSIRLFPPARAVAGQVPLLILMICYTTGGLTLLLAT
ncbi:hypothetical protein ACFQLX_12745 [Streptomyces polyrhachis]|uniref:Uncharacterized protein n=1 Tax=Streptomyces polyrhachis TaxID=1282885 RepID=A0ABW2GE20_9ACTN